MALDNFDTVMSGLASASRQQMSINKSTIGTQVSGFYTSYWRSVGSPGQGAIPAAAATCNKALLGGWNYNSPVNGHYWAAGLLYCSAAGQGIEIHDRLVHMGGLSGTVITAQTVNLTVSDTSSNLQARIGPADKSDLLWWAEIYTATGATVTTMTVAVTYTDLSTGTIAFSWAASSGASKCFLLVPAVGKFILSIQTATLTATTGTAGSFGFTCTRRIWGMATGAANYSAKVTWADTDLAAMPDNTCVTIMSYMNASTAGALQGYLTTIDV